MSTVAVIGGILLALVQAWSEYQKGAPARKAKANALATIEVDELDTGMDAVDKRLRGD